MAITGLEIYKLLPKTNCKKCGYPTCLAFAIALATRKVSLDKCPDVSQETKKILADASEPPIRTIKLKENYYIGGETVLFRHEKSFFNPTILGVLIKDTFDKEEIEQRLTSMSNLKFDRVGKSYRTELLFIKCEKNDLTILKEIFAMVSDRDFILGLSSKDAYIVEEVLKFKKLDMIGCDDINQIEKFVGVAQKNNIPLIVDEKNFENLYSTIEKITKTGFREIIIKVSSENVNEMVEYLTKLRRLAIRKNVRVFGYPTIVISEKNDTIENVNIACSGILKYASIVVLNTVEPYVHLALITLRLNIYTDPQKPVTVPPKLYSIGGQATEMSPFMVTTNFSLTYYSVEPEIINSKIPSWLLIVDTDGLSVLTAWAAEKFTPEKIVDAVKKENVELKIKHRNLIIPGYVAMLAGKISDLLPDWKVIVGPKESSGLPKFLKSIHNSY